MSSDNNIVSIKSPQHSTQNNTVTLKSVKASLDTFRATKKRQSAPIPKKIWDEVRILLKTHTEAEVLTHLSITRVQLEREKNAYSAIIDDDQSSSAPDEDEIIFCEAELELSYPLDSKPAEAFATNTSIVELYRPDGMLMKIHICTDRFDELLRAFFKG
jgi:hypothetical protein